MNVFESLSQRLPPREQARLLFFAIVFPVNFWALLVFLQELPAYILRLNVWDITGILAYILTIALADSLILFMLVAVILFFLPAFLRRLHYAAAGTSIAYLTVLWLILIQYQEKIGVRLPIIQQRWFIWVWLAGLLACVSVVLYLLNHFEKLEQFLRSFLDRLSLLSTVYLFLNLAGLLVVIGRNLSARIR